MAKNNRPTKAEALAPFPLICTTCKGPAIAYALPLPGATFCAHCSPGWLGEFLRWRNSPHKLRAE